MIAMIAVVWRCSHTTESAMMIAAASASGQFFQSRIKNRDENRPAVEASVVIFSLLVLSLARISTQSCAGAHPAHGLRRRLSLFLDMTCFLQQLFLEAGNIV